MTLWLNKYRLHIKTVHFLMEIFSPWECHHFQSKVGENTGEHMSDSNHALVAARMHLACFSN